MSTFSLLSKCGSGILSYNRVNGKNDPDHLKSEKIELQLCVLQKKCIKNSDH